MSTRRLYFVDAYNAGDPSFLAMLGKYLVGRGEGAIVLLDPTDRLLLSLEGAGAGVGQPISEDGVIRLANEPEQRELALRVVTEFARTVTATLTELQVPAVSLLGSDRGLLRRGGPEGVLDAGRGGWLFGLVAQGVVPVLSPVSKLGEVDKIHLEEPANVLEAMLVNGLVPELEIVVFADGRGAPRGRAGAVEAHLVALGHRSNVVRLDPTALRDVGTRETAGM